jgi:hypothetical protein
MMGEKGLKEGEWTDRSNWRRKIIIAKWAQEDVETLYNLLNKNNNKRHVSADSCCHHQAILQKYKR